MGSDLIEAVPVSKSKSSPSAGKCFPPGFRFHPTDEELVLYYLKRKICGRSLKLDIIGEVDVYKWDPEELPGQSKLKSGDRQWFFFSPRDRKYPNGGRSSRATMNGYWKATGKDRIIKRKSFPVGIKKTLVYYQGRAPSGLRTDWVMHEYTMDEEELKRCPFAQEHFVLYKIFKKSGPGPKNGEQYGAPFVEEEWSDEDCVDLDAFMIPKRNPIPIPMSDLKNVREEEEKDNVFTNDIVEFLNKIIDEPDILPPPPVPQVSEKTEDCFVDSCDLKDFLELDDLTGPDPGIGGSVMEAGIGDSIPEFGLLSDFDFYHDSITRFVEYGPENSGVGSEVQNGFAASYDDLWDYNQGESTITTTTQTIQHSISQPSSGVIMEENPVYYNTSNEYEMENGNGNGNGNGSWLSSALWSFVDNIPTTPASASESTTLVNRAFERMSSFGRGKNVNLAAASGSGLKRLEKPMAKAPRSSSSSRGIVYFSVLGVLFAILWVCVGSSMELLGRCIW